jgi:hypothetical protein
MLDAGADEHTGGMHHKLAGQATTRRSGAGEPM